MKISKKDKFAFEEKEENCKAENNQRTNTNSNLLSLIDNYHNKNIENLNSLLTNSNSCSTKNKQIDLVAKKDLKEEFNYIKNKISNANNLTNNLINNAFDKNKINENIQYNNKINNSTEDSIHERNKTLKNLEILNYGEADTEYENSSSTVHGVNKLSSNQLSLNVIKNYLKENLNNNKPTNNSNNNFIENVSNQKAKSISFTNALIKKANKRSNSFSSLEKIEDSRSKILQIFAKPENEVARINASYEVKSPRKKVNKIELDLMKIDEHNVKRIDSDFIFKNALFDTAVAKAKNVSENNKSKNVKIKLSNNNMQENFFLHSNTNGGSTNQITSSNINTITSINNNFNHNYKNNNNDDKNFVLKLKSLNDLFLTSNGNKNDLNIISNNNPSNNNIYNNFNNSSKNITEKIKDLNFNFNQSNNNFKTLEKSKNSFLLASLESRIKKAPLFDEKITFNSNHLNNDLAKKISSFSNISNQAKIKLNEINSLTERLKTLGSDKDIKAEDLFKNKKLFVEAKKSECEQALHKSKIYFILNNFS